jgi:hypothetical protein
MDTIDFIEFSKNSNLINCEHLYTNYDDNVTTLLSSDKIIDKNSFKYYIPSDSYKRIRGSITRLSNNIGESYIAKIKTILDLYKLENANADVDSININNMDTIYLGDDFVLFIDDKGNYGEYVLPYDDRAKEEVNIIKEKIEKN